MFMVAHLRIAWVCLVLFAVIQTGAGWRYWAWFDGGRPLCSSSQGGSIPVFHFFIDVLAQTPKGPEMLKSICRRPSKAVYIVEMVRQSICPSMGGWHHELDYLPFPECGRCSTAGHLDLLRLSSGKKEGIANADG